LIELHAVENSFGEPRILTGLRELEGQLLVPEAKTEKRVSRGEASN